jgi:YHS domain-containing protein
MNELKCVTKDPTCGMVVDETTLLRVHRDGKLFFFCSHSCRQEFLSAPAGAKPEEKSCC